MKLLYNIVFLGSIAAALPGVAQQTLPSAASDTTGHMRYSYGRRPDRFYLGTLIKVDGTEIIAYLPTRYVGYERDVEYFLPPLAFGDLRHRHTLKMKEVKSMAVRDRRYETIQERGKNTDILALNLFDGPIALSVYAEPRAVPIPIPLGVGVAMPILGINLADKNHWYLHRNGVCTEMPKGKFAELMSAYLVDNPELAGKVARKETNYQHADTPAIVAEYNRAKAASGH
jgi:hypothetical protein